MNNKYTQLDDLYAQAIDVCKGYDTQLMQLYNCPSDVHTSISKLSNDIVKHLPKGTNEDERNMFLCFMEMIMYYLEACFPLRERTLLSIKKISDVVLYKEPPLKSVLEAMFEITVDNEQILDEELFLCAQKHYSNFNTYASLYYNEKNFGKRVDVLLEKYAKENNLSLTSEEIENSAILGSMKVFRAQVGMEYKKIKNKKSS